MERCPVCRARLNEVPKCARCGTDLTIPRNVIQQARAARRQALDLWHHGHTVPALKLMRRAERLQQDSLTSALVNALVEQNVRQAVKNLQQGDSTTSLYLCRQVLAARTHHPLARAMEGFLSNE